jgi:hypothetical protein
LLAQLTEEETEYKVVCVRHVLEGHLVLQFNCTNTVREQVLEGVSVAVDLAEAVRGGEEGDAGCHSVRCVHGGGPPLSQERRQRPKGLGAASVAS